jgi:hypothetical protein
MKSLPIISRILHNAAAVLIGIFLTFPSEVLDAKTVTIRPEPDDQAILFNPGSGLVINNELYREGAAYNAWRGEIFNIAYTRFRWKDLEPEEGKYNFRPILDWMKPWLNAGYRVAFGVKSTDMEMTCTPEWVFRAGVPAVSHRDGKQRDPAYWHPIYMQKYSRFVKKLGETFDGMNGLEYVDMRGIGVWGEMHLGTFIKGMWTKDELSRADYSDTAYQDAYRRMIDAYRQAFPTTRLFLNIGSREDIVAYAASRHVGLRSDALNVTAGNDLREASRQFQKYCFNEGRRAVPCHYESAFEGRENNPLLFATAVDAALRDPVSYLFANPGDLHHPSSEIRNILKHAARRIGYRLVPVLISIESEREFTYGEALEIAVAEEWLNRGVAPIYFDFEFLFAFVDSKGMIVYEEIVQPSLPTSAWHPLQLVKFRHSLTLPAGLKNNDYTLTLAVTDPKNPGSRIKLGIKGEDNKKHYALAKISIRGNGNSRRTITVNDIKHTEITDVQLDNK